MELDGPFEAQRGRAPDWMIAALVFVAWLALRNGTYPYLWMSACVDVGLVGLVATVVWHFEAGDPPRRGWWLALATFTCSGIGIAMRDQPALEPVSAFWMHAYLLVNLSWSATILVFARNVFSIGLRPVWTWRSRVLLGAAVLLALSVGGVLMHGAFSSWSEAGFGVQAEVLGPWLMNASSAVADPLVFVGAALIGVTMLPMSGGAVARPYLLLSGSAAAYLTLDLVMLLEPEFWKITGQIVFSVGEGLFVAAAISQIQLCRRDR